MSEVKKIGKYKTKIGKEVEIYGFDNLGGGPLLAEGFLVQDKKLRWWDPQTGKLRFDRYDDTLDIVGAV